MVAYVLAGGVGAGVLARGGLGAGVLGGAGEVVEADDDLSRARRLLALVPAIHSVSRCLARLRTTFPLR